MGKDPQEKIKREFSSGGVVFKKVDSETLWLVTKSMPSEKYPKDNWRLPKGWIDDKENGLFPGPISSGEIKATQIDLEETAIREVLEEGGIEAKIVNKVGTTTYFYNSDRGRIMKFVTFFLMEYIKDNENGFGNETEMIEWLSFDDAFKRLTTSNEKQILKKANEVLLQ